MDFTFNLDIHPKYGFYQTNESGIKCEFMDLKGYSMQCNHDMGVFKKGGTYLIHTNTNDEIFCDDDDAKQKDLKEGKKLDQYDQLYGYLEKIPVNRFQDGTFTFLSKD